jgi:thiosulfate/3-mercaptopyruvate sulfurtransferase
VVRRPRPVKDALVDPQWLTERLSAPFASDLVVVDLRWREDGTGYDEYLAAHIPGARFCDWTDDMVDPDHRFAFMLAPPERFGSLMGRLGIGDGTTVVAYADQGGSGPFRLWWACRVYGHDQVRILDGGLERWVREGRSVESGDAPARACGATDVVSWSAGPSLEPPIATADDVASAGASVVLDSRPALQFRGEAVWFETGSIAADTNGIAMTPRGPLRAGHVPWATNVPSAELYGADGRLKEPDELRTLFAQAGVAAGDRVITYCGVGISASALLFALRRAGIEDVRLYDASWEEWGRDLSRPVAR